MNPYPAMDNLTKEFHSFLVKTGYQPDSISHEMVHALEHIIALLGPDDEDDVVHYFGLFGEERLSLDEIARNRQRSPEDMMAHIDSCLRRLAVTPEWQMVKAGV